MKVWLLIFSIFSSLDAYSSQTQADNKSNEVLDAFSKINAPNKVCDDKIPKDLEYVCEDLNRLSCKSGSFADGTGTAYGKEEVLEKLNRLRSKALPKYKEKIAKILKQNDPEYAFIKRLALKATNQTDAPNCISAELKLSKECIERVSKILASMKIKDDFPMDVKTRIETPGGGNEYQLDFEAMESLNSNELFSKEIKKTRNQLKSNLTQNGLSKKVEKEIFPRVQTLLISKIKELIKDEKVQERIIQKVKNIQYDGINCTWASENVSASLVSNASYNPQKNTFQFCNGKFLAGDSEFTLVNVIAHELGHSIDPCYISKPASLVFDYPNSSNLEDLEKAYPIQNLIPCLRTGNSVGAYRYDWTQPPPEKTEKDESKKSTKTEPLPSEGTPIESSILSDQFCGVDQVGESVSDWLASEVLPEYIDAYHPNLSQTQKIIGYSNVWRRSCDSYSDREEEEYSPYQFDVHPTLKSRNNAILLANPKIRAHMGCTEKGSKAYCMAGAPVTGTSVKDKVIEAVRKNAELRKAEREERSKDESEKGGHSKIKIERKP